MPIRHPAAALALLLAATVAAPAAEGTVGAAGTTATPCAVGSGEGRAEAEITGSTTSEGTDPVAPVEETPGDGFAEPVDGDRVAENLDDNESSSAWLEAHGSTALAGAADDCPEPRN